tara:strand:+ start:160 stop:630 length:471 start_codon:yes stop_codon:yes gene_type:complete
MSTNLSDIPCCILYDILQYIEPCEKVVTIMNLRQVNHSLSLFVKNIQREDLVMMSNNKKYEFISTLVARDHATYNLNYSAYINDLKSSIIFLDTILYIAHIPEKVKKLSFHSSYDHIHDKKCIHYMVFIDSTFETYATLSFTKRWKELRLKGIFIK